MNSWQIGDVKISCVVEFKSVVPYDAERGLILGATPARNCWRGSTRIMRWR